MPEPQQIDRRIQELTARLPETLGPTNPPPADAVIARATARGTGGDAPPARAPRLRPFRRWLLAAAAILAVGLPGGLFLARTAAAPDAGFGAESFVTGPEETATLTLRDGTVVKLATSSRLELEPSRTERLVALDGQAYFAVAHRNQPFVIRTRTGDIRVLGTRFDLAARDDDLQLVVVEGRVAVSARGLETEVRASQMGRVVNGTPLPVQDVADPHALTGWVGQFLAFQATPLADVAREIERHYDIRIRIANSALARRTITAWFSDWKLDDVMTVVCTIAEARCETNEGVITIEPTRP